MLNLYFSVFIGLSFQFIYSIKGRSTGVLPIDGPLMQCCYLDYAKWIKVLNTKAANNAPTTGAITGIQL